MLGTEQVSLDGKAPTCGAFAEPSDGLEPSTPSLPWSTSFEPMHDKTELRQAGLSSVPLDVLAQALVQGSRRRMSPRRITAELDVQEFW
jgi:hypothetical protein